MDKNMVGGPQACFENFLRQGQFMLQRSRSTGKYIFYPRVAVPMTGERDLEWVKASGRGVIYSITFNHTRTGTYNIALVDLEEGPRMMTTIIAKETPSIGSAVIADIEIHDDEPRIVFRLVEEQRA